MTQGLLKFAHQVIDIEAKSVKGLKKNIGKSFEKALRIMVACKGRIILTGMGKPGFIGRKIAATLASTGTPSFFVHPAEAIHGDLGMIKEEDVLLAISQSGETEEIVRLLSTVKKIGTPMIAMTSRPKSTLARNADVVLNLGVTREACPLNLAPSASTTASLAMGDALALCLSKKKGFKEEDFAVFHPGGSLGKKLLRVKDIMRKGKDNPTVNSKTSVRSVLMKITQARAGSCTVVDKNKKVYGIFTDGDLRRQLRRHGEKVLNKSVADMSTRSPMTIHKDRLAAEAIHLMKTKKIDELPVVDDKNKAVGLLDVQDLLKAGYI